MPKTLPVTTKTWWGKASLQSRDFGNCNGGAASLSLSRSLPFIQPTNAIFMYTMFMFNQEMHDSSLIYEYIRKVKTSRHLSVIHSVDALWICFVSSILHCPAHIFSHFLTFYLSFSVCCSHSFANIAKPKSSYHRFAGITFCMWVCRFFQQF